MTAAKIVSISGRHRFWDKVDKNGPVIREELGPCWLWTAAQDADGYGRYGVGQTVMPAHRFSYERAHPDEAPLPPHLFVMHKCDNPPCVRPDHLGIGTNAENLRDMAEKGRARGGRRTKDGREPRNRRNDGEQTEPPAQGVPGQARIPEREPGSATGTDRNGT